MKLAQLGKAAAAALVGIAALLAYPAQSMASTAQGTVIENKVTVSYDAGGGVTQTATASAFVTVTLVQGAPNITASSTSAAVNQGATTNIVYTVTATSNGQETYNFGSAAGSVAATNMTTVGTGGAASPLSFSLGATTLAANAGIGANTIKVPYNPVDTLVANSSINGIAVGDTIIISGLPYQVASISKTNANVWGDPNYNMVTITLGSNITVAASAGQVIGERTTFQVTYSSGTVDSGGTSGTFTVAGTAKSATGPTGTSNDTTVTTSKPPSLGVTKEVSIDGGTTFFASASAAPASNLVYRITVTNNGGSNATSVKITDTLPPYLTYIAGQSKYATSAATTYAAATALTQDVGGYDFGTTTANTITYNPGSPGIGTVAPGSVLVLFYSCKIN